VVQEAASGLSDAVLVDVGAGEGYLSSALSVLLHLPLVGIDCSESNVQGRDNDHFDDDGSISHTDTVS
jgi:2-polyprenyl-3-methyl-5-hydroxy-6-metoxy-1,4-benzoquinol methylase